MPRGVNFVLTYGLLAVAAYLNLRQLVSVHRFVYLLNCLLHQLRQLLNFLNWFAAHRPLRTVPHHLKHASQIDAHV